MAASISRQETGCSELPARTNPGWWNLTVSLVAIYVVCSGMANALSGNPQTYYLALVGLVLLCGAMAILRQWPAVLSVLVCLLALVIFGLPFVLFFYLLQFSIGLGEF